VGGWDVNSGVALESGDCFLGLFVAAVLDDLCRVSDQKTSKGEEDLRQVGDSGQKMQTRISGMGQIH